MTGSRASNEHPPAGAIAVLRAWERAAGLSPRRRALLLAADGLRESDDRSGDRLDALARQPLGTAHVRLLQLRAATFGSDLDAIATCPQCGEAVEFRLDASELAASGRPAPAVPLVRDGYRVEWRSPTPADVDAAGEATGRGDDPERELLLRCVDSVLGPNGQTPPVDEMPPAVRTALAQAMSQADPLAEVLVEVSCLACRTMFETELDVAEFVWAELQSRARRVLLDVDVLARAYGWTEPDVLALSETRRAAYLRLATQGLP